MRVDVLALVACATAACATPPPPRATLLVFDKADSATTILVTPTKCEGCPQAMYGSDGKVVEAAENVDEGVDPVLRLKMELAGYTLVDVHTLRLETAERTDASTKDEITGGENASTVVEETPTVASLGPEEQRAAAHSLGIAGILSSTLVWKYPDGTAELVLALDRSSDGQPVWVARCVQPQIELVSPKLSGQVLANCLGDAVLALRAPEAILTRTR